MSVSFLKIKNKFINLQDVKSFEVECAKEYVGDYDYPDGMCISDLFLILHFYDGTTEEHHYYTHYKTEDKYDECDEFKSTMKTLIGEDSFEELWHNLINTKTYRNGNDYVRPEDKIEFGDYGQML